MSLILGINAYHGDASACIIKDGVLIAAVEEERFLRIKHWAGFPKKSIDYCLQAAGVELSDLNVVAINTDPKANYWRKILHIVSSRVGMSLIRDRLENSRARKSLGELLKSEFPEQEFQGEIRNVEHHLAHLSSAFHVSPYKEATVVSVDGFGDFASGSWGIGNTSDITIEGKVHFPHSLGAFYQSVTQLIGFPNYGDEYKVMGLAPYGKPVYLDEMRKIVLLQADGSYKLDLRYFVFHKQKVAYEWSNGSPSVGRLFSDILIDLLGPVREINDELTQRHKDLAASAQAMYEEALMHLLNKLHDKHGLDNLCLAGGCGNNSVANGKIRTKTKFKNVYIASSSGDAGGAIGAAYSVYFQNHKRKENLSHMDHAYLGPAFSNGEILSLLDSHSSSLPEDEFRVVKTKSVDELVKLTATKIAEGSVVGWFQGRMEWGPRALGNRSILGDPRRLDMKEILNQKIKRREILDIMH